MTTIASSLFCSMVILNMVMMVFSDSSLTIESFGKCKYIKIRQLLSYSISMKPLFTKISVSVQSCSQKSVVYKDHLESSDNQSGLKNVPLAITILKTSFYIFAAFDRRCDARKYQCANGHCISANRRCDGSIDCLGGDDEEGCSKHKPSYVLFTMNLPKLGFTTLSAL